MSADQPGPSFGDPNAAAPPTPNRTPTSAVLPSPVFETPKNNQGRFDGSTGWTPRFAEEYSVFNATPGNLRGSRTPFPDFGPATPFSAAANHQKRSLSTDGIGLGVVAHVNELSPNPNLSLPPVEPSKILRSSPTPLHAARFDSPGDASQLAASVVVRSAKKARRGTIVTTEEQGQTATPPPSAHKGGRKLAPKLDTTTAMQHDQDFAQQAHFLAAAQQQQQQQQQQQGMGSFVTAPGDMFGYPLAVPAAAAAGYGVQRSFWDPDPSLATMDIDFSVSSGSVFQPPTPHQAQDAVDWARASQLLQGQGGMAGHGGDMHASAGESQPSLVSQSPMSMLVTSAADHSMFAASYPTPLDDPFGMSDNGGAVNPGLIFSRPPSASMDTSFGQHMELPKSNPGVGQGSQADGRGLPVLQPAGRVELRRSASAKDATPRKQDRSLASSPVKEAGRPGLSRSFSENRGKKTAAGRPSLPTLAPRPRSQLMSNAGVNANKPVILQPQRPSSGRLSPPKSSHSSSSSNNHHRLSSLSSIPESSPPRARTQAKFTIDANGRARVETTVTVPDEPRSSAVKRHSSYSVPRRPQQWHSSEGEDDDDDDDDSSTDDEPIILPSRNTSFALPDPRKPSTIHPFHNLQRSASERSTTSYTSFQGPSQDDEVGDSDGETVVNELTAASRNKTSGDALSELRKLRESRKKQQQAIGGSSSAKPKRHVSSYRGPPSTSPTTMSEASLPTPTAGTRTRGVVRCVCNRAEAGRHDLLVQCESCEMYVHGPCVSITQRTMPSIYICAFCSNTPNMRGGRLRDNGRLAVAAAAAVGGPPGSATSPLAHKSLKSFR